MERREKHDISPKETTSLLPKKGIIFPADSEKIKTELRLGELIREIRTEAQITQVTFAELSNTNRAGISRLESSREELIPEKDLPTLIGALYKIRITHPLIPLIEEKILTREDVQDKEVLREKIEAERQEKKWLITVHNASLPQTIKYLRLAERLPVKIFVKETEIGDSLLSVYDRELEKPSLHTLNKMIDTSPLDYQGKAAQLLRLKLFNKKIMTIEGLAQSSPGELVQYLRISKGFSQEELGKRVGLPQTEISKLENNTRNVLRREKIRNNIISWLEIAHDSPLAKCIEHKADNPDTKLPLPMIQGVTSQQYLLGNFTQKEFSPPLSKKDQDILQTMHTMKNSELNINKILQKIRELNNLSRRELSNNVIGSKGIEQIQNLEYRPFIPQDYTIMLYAHGLNYDIHHPITQLLLEIVQEQRTLQDGRKKKAKVL